MQTLNTSLSLHSWADLARDILDGRTITPAEALSVLESPDTDVPALLAAAYEVRRRYFGNTVQLYFLINGKSGLCPEDCNYCSQSKVSTAPIDRYAWISVEKLLEGAQRAYDLKACTYCIVGSGRGPTDRELDHVIDAVHHIKARFPLRICACLGILKEGQAKKLMAAGVERFNHNLNTSEEFHKEMCTTHSYEDRVRTVEEVKEAGISPCCGGIVGMGESKQDVVDMAFALRDLEVESIPVNFHIPVEGTPFADRGNVDPRYALKALCMFRFVNPDRELRIAGGRELHLQTLQPLGLYPANSIFVSDYLTTRGQTPQEDFQMIENLGFEIVGPAARIIPMNAEPVGASAGA
ncbi:MAG TPA: biotin synthase BioB [Capsulimonadaceae bacterium]|jgi:biotin synthase